MNRTVLFAGFASLLSMVVGCAADPAPASNDKEGAQSSEIGLANPAAVHCTKSGGTPSGDACVFADGSSCEQWAYFRGECTPAPKPAPNPTPGPICTPIAAPGGGPGVGLANPAAVYCEGVGGTTSGEDCLFSDGTKCEQWSFYRGECGQAHSFCNKNGGKISNVTEDMGGWTASYAVCTLPSGDSCEESEFAQNCGCL